MGGISSFIFDLATRPTADGTARSSRGLLGGLVGVTQRPNCVSAVEFRQALVGEGLCWAKIGSGLSLTGLGDLLVSSLGLLGSGLLLVDMLWLGDQLDSELVCRLLRGLLDIMSVSVELLLIRLLLSKRRLLWLLALLLGYSESDMMAVDWRCCCWNSW
jgi:hypothetical protein